VTVGEIVKRRNNTFNKLKSIVPTVNKTVEEEQANGDLKIILKIYYLLEI
jgi:hypothetical protein